MVVVVEKVVITAHKVVDLLPYYKQVLQHLRYKLVQVNIHIVQVLHKKNQIQHLT